MRTVLHIAAFIVLATAGAGLTLMGWQTLLPPSSAAPPSLEAPAEIDLGPQEFGSTVVGRFRLANRGGRELYLTGFGTSCSCAGVEVLQDGQPKRVEEIRLRSGQDIELSVRISVATKPGTEQKVFVMFKSNDPNRPEVTIQVLIPRITGGLSAEPSAVVFGEVPLGKPAKQVVRLYANGSATRKVHAVRSLQPDRFDARLVPFDAATASADVSDRLVAVVEVTAKADRPLRLDGTIEVELNEENRASDRIAVFGEVVPAVVARPNAVVLPRSVGGKPAYTGQVALTSRHGAEFTPVIESVPEGLTATVKADCDNPGQWLVDIVATPGGRAARTAILRLRADLKPGGSFHFDIPMTLQAVTP